MHHLISYRDYVIDTDSAAVFPVLETTNYFSNEEIDIALELIDEKLRFPDACSYQFIFAEYENEVIGYICYGRIPLTQASYDVYWIVVYPQHQGMGIGLALLSSAEEKIKSMHGKHVYIETSGRKLYEPTHLFYRKAGYAIAALHEDFYADGDSKIVFHKKL